MEAEYRTSYMAINEMPIGQIFKMNRKFLRELADPVCLTYRGKKVAVVIPYGKFLFMQEFLSADWTVEELKGKTCTDANG